MKIVFKLFALLVIGLSVATAWVWMEYQGFTEAPISLSDNPTFEVPAGSHIASVAKRLAQRGIISSERYFIWHAKLKKQAHKIKAGEYVLKAGTPDDLLEQLIVGKVKQYSLSIIEGWTVKEMLAAMAKSPHLSHRLTGKSPVEVMKIMGLHGHFEGQFYPDTYHFPKGMTDTKFLQRAYDKLHKTLQSEWQAREDGLPLKTPYEALILASIVEKETGVPEERNRVAGVFVNRLNKGMRLQTDPTVIYGLGDRYKGDIKRKHLREATAYNTYVIDGLPPSPIALVGQEAIHAVLHPEKHQYLYFVATGRGGHTFSKTLTAHNKAVKAYLKATR